MDLGAAQRLIAAQDPRGLTGLMQRDGDPAVSKAVAQQFGALFMQGLLRQTDGAGIAMTDGVGGGVVNSMFASTMGRVAMSSEKLGLTDMMLRSIEAKQRAAHGGTDAAAAPAQTAKETTGATASSAATGVPTGVPLAAYWQGNGMRPVGQLGGGHMRVPAAAPPGNGRPIVQASLPPFPITMPNTDAASQSANRNMSPISLVDGLTPSTPANASPQATAFAQQLAPLLKQAGAQIGVSARTLLAQAALETGWGQSVVGNNIFGVKAGSSWTGATVTTPTHEYENGQYVSINAAFRAYPSFAAAVQDFVSIVSNSQRFRAALGTGENTEAYGRALIDGGWATDIDYVRKLQSVAAGPSASAALAAAGAPIPLAAALAR